MAATTASSKSSAQGAMRRSAGGNGAGRNGLAPPQPPHMYVMNRRVTRSQARNGAIIQALEAPPRNPNAPGPSQLLWQVPETPPRNPNAPGPSQPLWNPGTLNGLPPPVLPWLAPEDQPRFPNALGPPILPWIDPEAPRPMIPIVPVGGGIAEYQQQQQRRGEIEEIVLSSDDDDEDEEPEDENLMQNMRRRAVQPQLLMDKFNRWMRLGFFFCTIETLIDNFDGEAKAMEAEANKKWRELLLIYGDGHVPGQDGYPSCGTPRIKHELRLMSKHIDFFAGLLCKFVTEFDNSQLRLNKMRRATALIKGIMVFDRERRVPIYNNMSPGITDFDRELDIFKVNAGLFIEYLRTYQQYPTPRPNIAVLLAKP
ncbi:hypothetical protein L3Y34_011087 [Caenorhabditis briggsae]|uniref:Uncharacterized protein n=1 Tax=Caenorhabditis briggsae TaxID=6238 RepID=A0AAE8ZVI4_CAEBR|nr:hypothetical protein L3Y34_011087 [Caenorhabditis briggsae]